MNPRATNTRATSGVTCNSFLNSDSRYTSCVRTLQRVLFSMPGIMSSFLWRQSQPGAPRAPANVYLFHSTRVTGQKMTSPQISELVIKNLNQGCLRRAIKISCTALSRRRVSRQANLEINHAVRVFPLLNKIAVGTCENCFSCLTHQLEQEINIVHRKQLTT